MSTSLLFDSEAYISQSVDLLFRELTIPQIHTISKDFKQKAQEANDELHTLVGNKYRDLIEIAEDVGEMYSTANEVRDRLASLLFQNSQFINFVVPDESNANKFELLIQKLETDEIKKSQQSKILNSLINNVLIKFNLKLLSYKTSPLKYTSNFIYYAKLFYTIERIFGNQLENNSLLNDTFQNLKLNFANYLEYELSNYNSSSAVIYSHDRFLKSQRLHESDLYNPQLQTLVQLNGDELFDVFDLHIDDDDDETSETGSEQYLEEDELKHEVYNRKLPPVVNYLISYIIIQNSNGDCITSDKTLKRFIDLRFAFMELILAEFNSKYSSSANFDFGKLLMYLENTFSYVNQYFEVDAISNNDLRKYLKLYTKDWNASDLFGFKNWIDNEIVSFDFDQFLSPVKETDFSNFFMLLYDFVSNSISQTLDVPQAFQVFYNFLVNLKRLELSKENSILLQRMQLFQTKSLMSLLDLVTKQVTVFISEHLKLLPKVKQTEDTSLSKDLFTSKTSDLIYSDISAYLTQLHRIALSPLDDRFCDLISTWFSKFLTITNILNISEGPKFSQPSLILSHLMSVLANADHKWDYFTADDLSTEIKKLEKDIYRQLWAVLHTFLKSMQENISELKTLKEIYFYLAIVLTLEGNILELTQNEPKITDQLSELSLALYEKIIESAPSEELISSIQAIPVTATASDIPSRPSLKLSSLVYLFNQRLSCGHTYKYGKLFSKSEQFIKLKNTWMEKVVLTLIKDTISKAEEIAEVGIEETKLAVTEEPTPKEVNTRAEKVTSNEETLVENAEEDGSNGDSKVDSNGNSKAITSNDASLETGDEDATTAEETKVPTQNTENDDTDDHLKVGIPPASSYIKRTEKYQLFANMVYLLHFSRGSSFSYQDEPLLTKLIAHINQSTEILEASTADVIAKSISEHYKSNKKLLLPILQN